MRRPLGTTLSSISTKHSMVMMLVNCNGQWSMVNIVKDEQLAASVPL